LVFSAAGAMGILPREGTILWHIPWLVQNDNVIAQPIITGTNQFCLSAGYGKGSAAFEVTRDGGKFSARMLWHNTFLKNKFTSSVFWNGYIYGLDEDILVCLDARTGERMWKDGRYGYGQLLLASGCLIILSADGELALVPASPARYEERARFQAIHGKTWNHPALADGRIFVRNAVEMACYDLNLP
jgi:outer membrane protein assembly factor BamB